MKKNSPQYEVNSLYFGFFLVMIFGCSLTYYFKQDHFLGLTSVYFIFYALGQAFLEVGVFVLVSALLKRWAPRWIFHLFIGISFLVLLGHYVDFVMLRLMDTSISYVFNFFFGSGIQHLLVGFLAMNLNPTMVGMIFGSILLLPLLGIGFYQITQRWRSGHLSLKQIALPLICLSGTLLISDLFISPHLNHLTYHKYQKALPLGTTFLSPAPHCYHLPKQASALQNEEIVQQQLAAVTAATEPLPNIYFFIIETLRRDFTGSEIAPNLASFAEKNITFEQTSSNANYTDLSWFALLHSSFPYRWTDARDCWKEGSVPLQVLKKLGYQIRIYSSADLRYFNIDQVLFGHSRKMVDHVEEYTSNRQIKPCDRDALAIDSFERDIDQHSQGTVFLFFLDSTHSEYSFPENWPLKFTPISEQISYLTISKESEDLEKLKNRYRNSIAYVDSLLGRFFSVLQEKNLYENSIIAITGDHGEEFFEEGALFHGTHLNRYQTNVPILCKFENNEWIHQIDPNRFSMSHIDIFPSILHYLTKTSSFSDLLDGRSIFEKNSWPYHISVLQNGANTPVEFTLEKDENKISARFINSELVEILETSVSDTEPLDTLILKNFPEAFDGITR